MSLLLSLEEEGGKDIQEKITWL